MLLSFRLDTLKLLAVLEPFGPDASETYRLFDLVRWGAYGVAITDGHRMALLQGRFFTDYDGSPVSSGSAAN
ncbi:MAG: hypothetical protein ABI616_15020 [Pseudomonadota bacterium]